MTAATAKKAPCRGGSDGSEINYALLGGKSARTQDIAQAIIAGEKNSVIAARFGVSRAHVSQVARRNGLPSKSRGSTLIDGQLFLLGRRILFDGNLKDEILCVNWYFAGGYVGSAKYGLMHRWIFGANTGCKVDHINGDTFDNRSANLRRITAQGSVRNRRRFSNAPTIFKGVRRTGNGWEAVINVDDQRVRLGFTQSAINAAHAYDAAARSTFADCARLNFPEFGEQSAMFENDVTELSLLIESAS